MLHSPSWNCTGHRAEANSRQRTKPKEGFDTYREYIYAMASPGRSTLDFNDTEGTTDQDGGSVTETEITKIRLMRAFVEARDPSSKVTIVFLPRLLLKVKSITELQ